MKFLDICKKNKKKYENLLLFQKKIVILQPVYYQTLLALIKMRRYLLLIIFFSVSVFGGYAEQKMQGVYPYESERKGWSNAHTTLEMSNWSLFIPAGLVVFDGDQGSGAKYGKNNTPESFGFGLGVTYDFTPLWGLTVELNTSSYGKNLWKFDMKVEDGERSMGYLHDAMIYLNFDLMDAFFPRRLHTRFSLYPQLGGGCGLYKLKFLNENGDVVWADKYGSARNPKEQYVPTLFFHFGLAAEWNLNRSSALGARITYKYYNNDYVDGNASALGLGNRNNDGVLGVDLVYRVKFNTVKRSHYRNMPGGHEHNLLMEKVIEDVKRRERDTLIINSSDTIYSIEKQVLEDVSEAWFVYFENGSFRLNTKAEIELQQMAYRMTELYPDMYLEIEGSCDDTGSDGYNEMLAKYRAKEVRDYLVRVYDIDPNRLIVRSVGKIKNVKSSYAPNRRVRMSLISKEKAEALKKRLKKQDD